MQFEKKTLIIAGITVAGVFLIGFFILKDSNEFSKITVVAVSAPGNQDEQRHTSDTGRYFLSRVELVEKTYRPSLIKCLFGKEGNEVYREWSAIYYPYDPPYESALVRVELMEGISLNEACFVKEMITEGDWEEVRTTYGFSREKFGR